SCSPTRRGGSDAPSDGGRPLPLLRDGLGDRSGGGGHRVVGRPDGGRPAPPRDRVYVGPGVGGQRSEVHFSGVNDQCSLLLPEPSRGGSARGYHVRRVPSVVAI